ncbi:unnamed protein product [Brassicogethes aeneus]|uniref:Glyceraldehyde-3-phosphate dehydrogenase n=1 Tax=Brassicogethes aeneus TaxID=1431903 RepID=A0A9P0AXF1_BRAAE|nr:unnamed protein product [Brassicogethes aeneus]
MSKGVGINGSGRIGRILFRILTEKGLKICALNDPAMDPKITSYLLKYDSVHGTWDAKIKAEEDGLMVNGNQVTIFGEKEPEKIPWKQANVDYVVESSGRFTTMEQAGKHKAKKVLITAPSKDAPMFVCGVNLDCYDPKSKVVSMASCTTNCLAPLLKIVHENFCIKEALMTTVHSATQSQNVLDGVAKKNWRLGRCTLNNIIPTSTGAAKAVGKIIPDLNGKVTGMAFRVPLPNVSVVDVTIRLDKSTNYDDIKCAVKNAANNEMKGIMGYTEDAVVSSDMIGTSYSAIFDATAGLQLSNTFVKLIAWYDNESGYCHRIADLLMHMMENDKVC